MSTMGVVLVGISIVFICMIIITLILTAFPVLMGTGSKKKAQQKDAEKKAAASEPAQTASVPAAGTDSDREVLLAVITAAVAAYLGDADGSNFRVCSFKRVGDNAPAWARTGRLENLTD